MTNMLLNAWAGQNIYASSYSPAQLNQQTTRGEAAEDLHFQEFHVGSWLFTVFDAFYCLGKDKRGVQDGTVRVNVAYRMAQFK